MNINIKDNDFTLQAEGTIEFCNSITQTIFYFKGVADWKQPNHTDELLQTPMIKDTPRELKEKLDQSPRNTKKHITLTEKCCLKCGISKPLVDFNKSKKEKLGVQNTCRSCQRKYNVEYKKRKASEKGSITIVEKDDKLLETSIGPLPEKILFRSPNSTALFLNWISGKNKFDIRDFAREENISLDDAKKIVSHQIMKNKLVQLSNTEFKRV